MALNAYFDPPDEWRAENATPRGSIDLRDGSVYVFHNPNVKLAVNVALATGRPLFVRGASGSGKSSFARSVARQMQRRYYERVISSRTQLRDLLWSVDELQRLRDAHRRDAEGNSVDLALEQYIQPGTLWWAFDPVSASAMGRGVDPTIIDWTEDRLSLEDKAKRPAVVLLDEIDKADPDLPNDLLVPLGSLEFDVEDIEGKPVAAPKEDDPKRRLLVVITTNEEREMPPAFLRRCVVITLPSPDADTLERIAKAHFKNATHPEWFRNIADKVVNASAKPSVAEYLDAIRACEGLDVSPDAVDDWNSLANLVLWKGR